MNQTQNIALRVAVTGTNEAARDLGVVDAAVGKVAGTGKQLSTSKVWDSYKSGAAGAVTSVEALAKSLGNLRMVSNSGNLKNYNAEIDRLARLSGVSSSAVAGLVRQMDAVRRNKALDELRRTAELSTVQFAKLQASTGDLSGAMGTLGRGAGTALLVLTGIATAVGYVAKVCFDAALQMDRLTKSYTSIAGSDRGAQDRLAAIYEVTDRLGLQFQTTAEAAKGFFAAGKGTSLEGELQNIFEGVSKAGAALSLSQEQVQGVFLALGQMISKGNVQAEELRGQLGERLPGAFNLAAKAMGVTTAELGKMLEQGKVTAEDMLPKLARELHATYGEAAVQAANGAQAAVNRLSTEWELFKASASTTNVMVAGINAVTEALKGMTAAMEVKELDKRLQAAGVVPKALPEDYQMEMWWNDPRLLGRSGYTDAQRHNMRTYGTDDGYAIAEQQRLAGLQQRQTENTLHTDKVLGDAARSYVEAIKNTLDAKSAKINTEFDAAIKAQLAGKAMDPDNSAAYDKRIATLNAERERQIAGLDKTGKAADRASQSFNATVAKMRETNDAFEANLVQSGNRLEVAAEKAQQKYALALAAIESELEKARRKGVSGEDREAYRVEATRKAELELEQERRRIETAQIEQERKASDMRMDFEKRYADMKGLTSEAVKKSLQEQYEMYKKSGVDHLRLEEWKQDQIQRASREGLDGAMVVLRDFQNEATNQAKGMNDAFSGLFRGLDQGFNTVWQEMLTSGKASFSSFKKLLASFLADIAHMAISRPIVVRVAGVVSGLFGGAGAASAEGGASGLAGGSGSMGGLGNLLGNVPITSFLPDSLTGGLGGILGMQLPGTSIAGSMGPVAGGLTSLGGAMMGGGLGSLGYGILGSMIGLPQNKYTGVTSGVGGALGAWGGSALGASMAASGAISGALAGSYVFPVVGTIIGALAGGLLGSLFGGKKSSPSVWISGDTSRGMMTEDWRTRFVQGSRSDRVDSGPREELWGTIGDFANQTVAGFVKFADALPAEYANQVKNALDNTRVDFGYYDVQTKKWEEHAQQAMEGIQKTLFESFAGAMESMNLSGKLGLNMDLSNQSGIEKAVQAVTIWKEMETALETIKIPVAALKQQTDAANAQMTAWIDTLRGLGWQEWKLAEVEAKRAQYVDTLTFALRNQFNMEMDLREAQLRGTGDMVSAQQAMWADWQAITVNFGADSDQSRRWQAYQAEALPKLAEELAKNQYQSEIDGLKQQANQQVQALKVVAEQLGSIRSNLLLDTRISPLTTEHRGAEAGYDFASAYAKAMTGDTEAARTLAGSAAGYLELLKAQSATSAEYEALFYGVLGQLGDVEKFFGSKIDWIDPGLLEQQKGNKTLEELLAEIKKLEDSMGSAVTDNAKALQDYLTGLLGGTIRTRASGGYTPAGFTLVGEEGPELVDFTRPGMVYTADQTRAMLHGGAGRQVVAATPTPETVALRQEVYQLRRDLLLALDRMEQHARRTAETVEGWDVDGLPTERDNQGVPNVRVRS